MIACSVQNDALIFKVRVVPRASRSEVIGEHDGALRVRVAAPPVDGAANDELQRTLARFLDVAIRDVLIVGGHSSKLKQVRVSGITREQLERLAEGNRSLRSRSGL
ncbi:MAG TPA: DUF167 domain-containing protein [Pyrinomonadaceae bacterium]